MGAIIIPFETRAEWEERLRCEMMAAYEAHQAGETSATLDALVQALNRLVALQMRAPQAQQWRKKLP
jgi:hypothetical protein